MTNLRPSLSERSRSNSVHSLAPVSTDVVKTNPMFLPAESVSPARRSVDTSDVASYELTDDGTVEDKERPQMISTLSIQQSSSASSSRSSLSSAPLSLSSSQKMDQLDLPQQSTRSRPPSETASFRQRANVAPLQGTSVTMSGGNAHEYFLDLKKLSKLFASPTTEDTLKLSGDSSLQDDDHGEGHPPRGAMYYMNSADQSKTDYETAQVSF